MIFVIAEQIGLGLVFLFLCYLCFAIPGWLLLNKLRLFAEDLFVKEVVSIGVGMSIFVLITYILAIVGLRDLIWVLVVVGVIGFVYRIYYASDFYKAVLRIFRKQSWMFWLILIVGVVGQVAVNAPSGMRYENGIYFWSSHGHDGVWHLALMREFQRLTWPFINPELAGQKLLNYHFFSDLIMSELARLFRFTNLDVYFRFMPVFNSLMLGLTGFVLAKRMLDKVSAGLWAMFFIFFAGSFGYLVTIPRSGNLVGESVFWVSQTQSVLGNPPHAMAFYLLMILMIGLWYWFKEKQSWQMALILVIIGSAIIEFKVYAGLLVIGGLLVVGIAQMLTMRSARTLGLCVLTSLAAMSVYLPNSSNSEGFLVWQPWWFIRTMVVAPDRLNMLDWELKRQTYIADHNWKRVIWLEGISFLIFLFGNLGMRFLGFWLFTKMILHRIAKSYFNLFFVSITTAAFWIPVFFLQKGVAWNAIQFNQYFLLLFGLLAAVSCSELFEEIKFRWLKYALISGVVILAVPTQIGLLWQFYANKPLSQVSYKELAIFDYLEQNVPLDSVILTKPFDQYVRGEYPNPPIPIYAWYGTGYVSAFSGRRTLLADAEQVQIMGYKVDDLIKKQEEVFSVDDPDLVNKYFLTNQVDYVYLSHDENFNAPIDKLNLALIDGNPDGRLYEVIK